MKNKPAFLLALALVLGFSCFCSAEVDPLPDGVTLSTVIPGLQVSTAVGIHLREFDMGLQWETQLVTENMEGAISTIPVGVTGRVLVDYWHPNDGLEYTLEQSPDFSNWQAVSPVETTVEGVVGDLFFHQVVLTVLDNPDGGNRQRQFFRVRVSSP